MISQGKKHSAVNKLKRAIPHYFLKIFLGIGLLIIFLAVHEEAFKYRIRHFSYGRNILDAYLDIVISMSQLQNFDKF